MTNLLTDRLTLSACTPADRADFIALEQDPEVMRYLNGGHAVDRATVGGTEEFAMPEGTEPEVWTARLKGTDEFVGWFGLWPAEPGEETKGAELGYRLARAHWGKGLAAEAAKALIDWGIGTQGNDRIFAQTMAVNIGSRRVMEKIGMCHVRSFNLEWANPFPGTEHGEVEYAITRDEWICTSFDPFR